jgi:hypothetical protein
LDRAGFFALHAPELVRVEATAIGAAGGRAIEDRLPLDR